MTDTPEWFLTTPRSLTTEEYKALADGWNQSGLGKVIILENMQPIRITPNGLETPDGAYVLTDEQFEQLLDATTDKATEDA